MLSQTTPARSGTVNGGGGGGGGPLSSARAGGRANGGVRLLWRGALEFGDTIALEGIAFISHLSFPSGPQASTSKVLAPSPIFPPRGSTSVVPTTPAAILQPSSASPAPPPPDGLLPSATLSKPKPKRAVLFSSGIESPSNPAISTGSSGEAAQRTSTPKAPAAFCPPSLPSPSPFPLTSPTDLMLSLALESLKGRPSIRYRGLVRIGMSNGPDEGSAQAGAKVEGSVEGEGGVRLYTDPRCPLILNFLRRQLLLTNHDVSASPHDLSPLDGSGRTTHGILIALGDESVESSNLVIYARRSPTDRSTSSSIVSEPIPCPGAMTLHLGRYHPPPPTPLANPPRPDDPAPRRRPSIGGLSSMLGSKEREKERAAAKRKAQALVPAVTEHSEPPSARKKAKGGASPTVLDDAEGRDVFGSRRSGSGSVAPEAPKKNTVAVIVSVKEESNEPEVEMTGAEQSDEKKADATVPPSSGRKKVNPQETHNKAHIKTATLQALLERGITKDDPEFKELWNWVVRGSGFALRDQMTTKIITAIEVLRVVGAHLELYLPAGADGAGAPGA